MHVIIAIPVYKNPDEFEIISLRRCCQVLSRYEMSLVCPEGFDTSILKSLWSEYGLVFSEDRFNPSYFINLAGYNRLMLSTEFYDRYSQYDYILIYQPDAFVFDDKLVEWCVKGYDYVGAPLFGAYTDKVFYKDRGRVGNGGLSLRRVKAFTDYFNGKHNVIPVCDIARRINLKDKIYTRWFVWLLMVFGWRNTPKSFADNWEYNEDDFWSGVLCGTNYEMKKPSVREAMDFAFERFPKEVYDITGCLPFGAHAWRKYEYEEFWRMYIK